MFLAHSVSEVIKNHVTLSVEGIDRMYLNVYVPQVQHEGGAAYFFREHRKKPFVSTALMAPMTRRTPGLSRTRVITEGVIPSIHVDYKRSRIKQYFKEGRALRTETTINNTYDFSIGKRLKNLPKLREVGFTANRRLLDAQMTSHNCRIGEAVFDQMNRPVMSGGGRASGIRFADFKTQMLLSTLLLFAHQPNGFANKELRILWAPLLGADSGNITQGQMTYHLRRLRLHGIIARIPGSHRYCVTVQGMKTAFFFTRVYARVLRPELSKIFSSAESSPKKYRLASEILETIIDEDCNPQ